MVQQKQARHPHRPGALWPEYALPPLALLAWVLAVVGGGGGLTTICLVVAGAATALACMYPWCRRRTLHTVEAATWSAKRERTEAVAASARYSARWQAIVDTATEGILTIDAHGTIETMNGAAERLFAWPASEAIGKNVNLLMPSPYHEEHDGYLQRYLNTRVPRIIGIGREVMGLRRDGTEFPIDLSVGDGDIDGRKFFTGVIRDVSDRKQMQTKLAQAERLAAVGELAAGVAHEVNNPINTIINCAQLIEDGDDPAANCRVITEEGQRVAEIVRDLLQFARDDRAAPHPTSLAEVVERTLRLVGENWKRHGIQLRVTIPDDLPPVLARTQQIQQVLLNLLINAKDALMQDHREKRCVELSAQRSDRCVQFTVHDNGPGVPDSLADRIFEPFVTTKRGRGGTGLGLSISRSIVESYGGTITLCSTPGEGAAFTVSLPLSSEDE
jgi:two-component system sensor kinase FixL